MKKSLHTMMLAAGVVALSAGAAMAADETMGGASVGNPATFESSATTQTQTGSSIDAEVHSQAAANTGNQVESVQAKLSQEGYPVSVDGVWGPQSASALRQFQQANNLDTSGKINAETLAALQLDASAAQGTAMGGSAR